MDFMTMIVLKRQYNKLTKDKHNIQSLTQFEKWLVNVKTFDDDFATLSKTKTVSGNSERLNWY